MVFDKALALSDPPYQGFSTVYIYVIGADRYTHKIGIAADVRKRMAKLQTGCPYVLQLVHKIPIAQPLAHKLEKALHRRLKRYKMCGEWFQIEGIKAVKLVENAASSFAKDHAILNADDAGMVYAWLHCRACHHAGSARVPATHKMRFKCSHCGSRETSWRMYGK